MGCVEESGEGLLRVVKWGRKLKDVWKTVFGIMDAFDYVILVVLVLFAIAGVIYGGLKWIAE